MLLQAGAGLTQLEALNLSGIQLSADVVAYMAKFTGLHELTAGEGATLFTVLHSGSIVQGATIVSELANTRAALRRAWDSPFCGSMACRMAGRS